MPDGIENPHPQSVLGFCRVARGQPGERVRFAPHNLGSALGAARGLNEGRTNLFPVHHRAPNKNVKNPSKNPAAPTVITSPLSFNFPFVQRNYGLTQFRPVFLAAFRTDISVFVKFHDFPMALPMINPASFASNSCEFFSSAPFQSRPFGRHSR